MAGSTSGRSAVPPPGLRRTALRRLTCWNTRNSVWRRCGRSKSGTYPLSSSWTTKATISSRKRRARCSPSAATRKRWYGPAMPPMTGRVIAGRYNLQTPIGRGAMGVVWRAHDRLLDREVAVKEVVISALIGAEERHNAYQRTLREARTAARLSHRGVVAVYDVAEEDGRPWIVMELVPSQSLDQLLVVESRLPAARAGRIGQQLLSALAAAHTAGVLHRDVKPSNVLIATNKSADGWDERAVLTDFGIAQLASAPRLTQTGMVMGSPVFTAPERIRGSDATPASDLWSLGATIYAAVEGRGPYENRGGAITTMSAIINEDAPVAPHAGQLAPIIA